MKEEIIVIQGLTKLFPVHEGAPPVYALKEIDLSIKKGEIFGIIGMSGAGKSTLIRCLTCLEKPTEGSISIGGEELTTLSPSDLRQARKKIGMIFQHFNLFSSRTALENVMYPLELDQMPLEERKTRALELLNLVGLKGKESSYPSQLSGGEKQRVAIARALARNPAVLFCDEATSALDPRTTHSILELLEKLNATLGLTLVLITHAMEVVKQICTRVAVLEHGVIVEEGAIADLFSSPKHPTTRRFLQGLSHDTSENFVTKGDKELLRLFFRGTSARKPIISRLIREHQVEVNILSGGIDTLKTETVGSLVVELSGAIEERNKARSFLKTHGVNYDELG